MIKVKFDKDSLKESYAIAGGREKAISDGGFVLAFKVFAVDYLYAVQYLEGREQQAYSIEENGIKNIVLYTLSITKEGNFCINGIVVTEDVAYLYLVENPEVRISNNLS